MRIGYCTRFSPDEVAWAKRAGFTTLEIGFQADGPKAWKKTREVFDAHGLAPMSVFHYADYGHPDRAAARKAIAQARQAMKQCVAVGAPVLACNSFAGHTGSPAEKLSRFKAIFTPMAAEAADLGLKIAIENCPHGLHSVAWSPAMWERMFDEVPNPALGLEFDPSHLVWMGIDCAAALAEFADRVYAVHAKDTEVLASRLAREGIYGEGWWRYRIPGWGSVPWKDLMTILWEHGFAGDITIEHEDPVFRGPRHREGLERGLAFLRDIIGSQAEATQ